MMHIESALQRMLAVMEKQEKTMGAVADALAGLPDALNAAAQSITTEIADLRNQLATAGLDDADNAALQATKDAAAAVEAIVPAPEPPPA